MEGDTAESLTEEFGNKHNLDANMRAKLKTMLQQQIDGILEKIEEEEHTSQITGEGSENHMEEAKEAAAPIEQPAAVQEQNTPEVEEPKKADHVSPVSAEHVSPKHVSPKQESAEKSKNDE
jgi:hypothetical protein